jgi:hypothetical protein
LLPCDGDRRERGDPAAVVGEPLDQCDVQDDLRDQFIKVQSRRRGHRRPLTLDRSRLVYFFLAGSWCKYPVEETVARLIRLIPKMVQATDLTDRGRFELPINAGSKLRTHLI